MTEEEEETGECKGEENKDGKEKSRNGDGENHAGAGQRKNHKS